MTELNGPNFSVNKANYQGIQKPVQDVPAQEAAGNDFPQYTDFSDPKAEALGRSMVKSADNVNNDLKALLENPQIAENSDKMFEASFNALQNAGVENRYEEASTFSTGNV